MSLNDRVISLILLLALLVASFMVLAPFLPALFWASVLAFSTWPVMTWLTKKCNGRETLAASLLTGFWVLIVAVPLLFFAINIGEHTRPAMDLIKGLWVDGLPPAPTWLNNVPLVGAKATEVWVRVDKEGADIIARFRPYAGDVSTWLLARTAQVGRGMAELALSLVLVFFFYRSGTQISGFVNSLLARLIGGRSGHYVNLVGSSIQSVVNGVIGTAAAQAVLALIGFAIAGVPGALFLGIATFFLSLIPMGPPLVWLPAVGWLAYQGEYGMAAFLGIWCVLVVSGVDNILKPILISRGGTLPLIVVLIGIFGGMLAFGFMGIFLGPTLLAVAYSLLNEWMQKSKV